MADLRSHLERLGERVRVAPDAFERLERARRRHERNRRITAGVVALSVAVAGSFIAFSTFRSGDGVRTVGSGGSNEAPVDVAQFTCDASGSITPSNSVVAAQPDGVHVAISNTGDTPVSFSIEGLGGGGAEPGEHKETVWQIPPGPATVSCGMITDGGTGVASSATLEVVDPNGLYVPADLECASGEAYGSGGDYADGANGFAGDPVQVARDHVWGLEFDDLIERAGYPDSRLPVIRVVRDGAIVGKVTLRDDGSGGWLDDSVEGCSGTRFGWSVEPTGVSGPMGQPMNAWDALCATVRAGDGNSVHNGADLRVDGRDADLDTSCLIAPAGRPLTILFGNLDDGVPRSISIYR